jgi:hypothetical protein
MKKKYFLAILVSLVIMLLCAPLSNASSIIVTDNQYFHIQSSTPEVFTGTTTTKTIGESYTITYNGTSRVTKIGSGTTGNFVPKMTFGAWDECQIELTLDSNVTGQIRNSLVQNPDGSLTVGNNNFSFYYKPVNVVPGFNDMGGLDFALTLTKKPGTTISLPFIYNSQNVTGYLQPSLTSEYSNGWSSEFQDIITVTDTQVIGSSGQVYVERPIYVVNSIAFYANDRAGDLTALGGKNYKAGKVGQLYRLKAVDSSAIPKTSYFDWAMPDSTHITLNDNSGFLASATYPVIISPMGDTFGWSTVGGTGYSHTYDTAVGTSFTAPSGISTATINSITCWVKELTAGATNHGKGLIALTSTLALVANGVGGASSVYTGTMANPEERTSTFSSSPSLSDSTAYLLAWVKDNPGGTHDAYVYYDTVSGPKRYVHNNNYTTPVDLTGASSTSNRRVSIYCTYTPSGGGGWTHISYVDGISESVIGYLWGVIKASIGKVNGVTP